MIARVYDPRRWLARTPASHRDVVRAISAAGDRNVRTALFHVATVMLCHSQARNCLKAWRIAAWDETRCRYRSTPARRGTSPDVERRLAVPDDASVRQRRDRVLLAHIRDQIRDQHRLRFDS